MDFGSWPGAYWRWLPSSSESHLESESPRNTPRQGVIGMALGSNKPKQPTRAEILERAAKQDLRRQEQIAAQSATLDRLLTEHQMLEGLVGELAAESDEVLVPGNVTGYRDKAKEVLANIERLREDARKKREKKDGE